ncbi:hypothetical protein HYPSUDRAFT_49520 [Hypholoma sublateritium FD-334 SS-4]|uniref:Uncharacterized protein n=1 Tax=Hypholoma sublateritium (strain FD-334 SS-4) TaxID=945553 RepID=A0A0D2N3U9_HYPSF|nr:hypothetical protein HYPSUDRAFT_49520 [Hypholoma sublateritium FD-334 SS-4]
MISELQNSLASAFRKALQFLGMSLNAPIDDPLPFETLDKSGSDIERYINNLLNGYNAHGSLRMEQYMVTEMYHCKEDTRVGHEYVSAKVVGPRRTFYLVFERFRGLDNKDESITYTQGALAAEAQSEGEPLARRGILRGSSEAVQASCNTSLETIDDIADKVSPVRARNAVDRVSVSTTQTRPARWPHPASYISRTVTLKDPIQLYQVAVLAATVHYSAKTYKIDLTNCYFYAEAMIQVMKRHHRAVIGEDLRPKRMETGKVPYVGNTLLQNVCSNLPTNEQMSTIMESYQSALEDFERKARAKDDQLAEIDARARSEAARATSEAARADWEAQRRAEETARADQEAQKARDYEADIARLKQQLVATKPERYGAASHI